MEYVLSGLHWGPCVVYLDDIIVSSKSSNELITGLSLVFDRIQSAGSKISPKSVIFSRNKFRFLVMCEIQR